MIHQIFAQTHIRGHKQQLGLIQRSQSENKPVSKVQKPRLVNNLKLEDDHIIVSDKRIEVYKTLEVLSKHFKCDIQKLIDTHLTN